MRKLTCLLGFLLAATSLLQAQKTKSVAAPAAPPAEEPVYKNLKYRLIGPFRGGRSAAVAGSFKNRNTFYFGGVGGGVWKTTDGGSNWFNISDKFFGGSIGSVAVAPSDETILYAGEGEHTMRGNVSEGLQGIWRSDDGGKNWRNLGLKDGRHIIRIVIHPKNPDIVWVAVMGHLFGPNEERGVFKTTDGGKSWRRVLYVNNQTGCSELVMEPGNPQVLYAGTWRVIRSPHSLESGGEGSGLWKSTDGGETWTALTGKRGLPRGTWGIVGVAVAPSNTDKVYALVENEKGGLFMSTDGGENWTLQSSDNNIRQRAWYYSKVFVDPKNENKVYCPNVGFMISSDGGKNFYSISTPHGDHHDLWIDPEDPSRMIVADDGGAQVSFDGGANWSTYMNQPTVQVYRVSTDNAFPYRILGGQQDNSAFRIRSRSYGAAIAGDDFQSTAGGESGYVVADPLNPDITYGGSYMGYLSRVDHRTNEFRLLNIWPDDGIGAGADVQKYRFQWNYPIFYSPHDPKKLYAAGNHLFATTDEGRSWQQLSPDLTTNDKSRQAPSGGPITKDNTGVEYYCTIFTAAESPYEKDLLWTGSDDGLIHVSRDGGKTWNNVTPKDAPKWMMWNCVEPDPFTPGGAYFIGTRYKLDDFSPYIYKTTDYGQTWKRVDNGINRLHFTRALRADRKRKGLLYAGTEYGMYISYDDGASWQSFQLNLPVLSVTDLAIKENDLIVGTQGRSIYILDDLGVVQQAQPGLAQKKLHVFTPHPAYRMSGGRGGFGGTISHAGQNPPNGVVIPYFVKDWPDSAKLKVVVLDRDKKEIRSFATGQKENGVETRPGLNQFVWDLNYPDAEKIPEGMIIWNGSVRGPRAIPGTYYARFVMGSDSAETAFEIKSDPNYKASQAGYEEQFAFLLRARDKFSDLIRTLRDIRDLRAQLKGFREKWGDAGKKLHPAMDSLEKKMTAVEEALHQTKAKSSQDVLNYPIRLDDKLSGLYNNALAGEGVLSRQVRDAYDVIGGQIDTQLAAWKNLLSNELVRLNEAIRREALPVLVPDKL